MEAAVFGVGALLILAGALGVVLSRNPVHSALSLVMTLFGVAVLFVAQEANFLAAVQVIVYAGAIVVLFLFVIMLLGVDRAEKLSADPLVSQRILGVLAGVLLAAGLLFVLLKGKVTGAPSSGAAVDKTQTDVTQISHLLFTDYLFAFEITSVLLVIGVVGAVVLAKRRGEQGDGLLDEHEPVVDLDESDDVEGSAELEEAAR